MRPPDRSRKISLSHAVSVAVGVILIPLIFPAAVRATGLALAYSLGVAIFGGAATYVVIWLVGVTGNPLASTYYVLATHVVMLTAILFIRKEDIDLASWPPPASREV